MYKELIDELIKKKDKIDSGNMLKINIILKNYIKNGIKYDKTMNKISEKTLLFFRKESVINDINGLTEFQKEYINESSSETEYSS